MEEDVIITLIGTKLAKVGNEFVFRGGSKDCEPCKLYKTCISLNPGSRYRIVNLRNTGRHECSVHDSGVCAVEVIEVPIRMAVDARRAIKGSKSAYEPVSCALSDCDNFILCHPRGIAAGDRFTITNVEGDINGPCEKGFSLKVVEVKR